MGDLRLVDEHVRHRDKHHGLLRGGGWRQLVPDLPEPGKQLPRLYRSLYVILFLCLNFPYLQCVTTLSIFPTREVHA